MHQDLIKKERELAGDKPSNIDITSESEIHKTENEGNINISTMEDFLSSFSRKTTRRMYQRGLQLFIEWYQKDIDKFLLKEKMI